MAHIPTTSLQIKTFEEFLLKFYEVPTKCSVTLNNSLLSCPHFFSHNPMLNTLTRLYWCKHPFFHTFPPILTSLFMNHTYSWIIYITYGLPINI